MTPNERFGLIIGAIGVAFTIMCALIGLLWRTASGVGKTLAEVKANGEDVKEIAKKLDTHLQWHIDGQGGGRRR